MTTARTLTDADVEAIAEAVARRMTRAANERPKAPPVITETMAAAARAELERRALLAPKRRR